MNRDDPYIISLETRIDELEKIISSYKNPSVTEILDIIVDHRRNYFKVNNLNWGSTLTQPYSLLGEARFLYDMCFVEINFGLAYNMPDVLRLYTNTHPNSVMVSYPEFLLGKTIDQRKHFDVCFIIRYDSKSYDKNVKLLFDLLTSKIDKSKSLPVIIAT